MTTRQHRRPPQQRARTALAAYLRLLAACLEDEAEMIESDEQRAEEVLRRFRDGVISMSLDEAPLDALIDRMVAGPPQAEGGNGDAPVLVAGTPASRSRPRKR